MASLYIDLDIDEIFDSLNHFEKKSLLNRLKSHFHEGDSKTERLLDDIEVILPRHPNIMDLDLTNAVISILNKRNRLTQEQEQEIIKLSKSL